MICTANGQKLLRLHEFSAGPMSPNFHGLSDPVNESLNRMPAQFLRSINLPFSSTGIISLSPGRAYNSLYPLDSPWATYPFSKSLHNT